MHFVVDILRILLRARVLLAHAACVIPGVAAHAIVVDLGRILGVHAHAARAALRAAVRASVADLIRTLVGIAHAVVPDAPYAFEEAVVRLATPTALPHSIVHGRF